MKNFKKIIFGLFLISLFLIPYPKGKAQSLTISSNINLDWQVLDSYTPPFYEGKALAGESSYIKAVANVEILTPVGILDPSKLFYAWRYNNLYSHIYSKTGNNVIYFTLDLLEPENTLKLSVYENNKQKNLLAEKVIKIPPQKSQTILYRKNDNPILTYANAINKRGEHYIVNPNEEFEILAEPYYFSVKNPNESKLTYTWSVNNIPGNIAKTNIFFYKAPKSSFEDFGIGLEVSNSSQVMQSSKVISNFILKK